MRTRTLLLVCGVLLAWSSSAAHAVCPAAPNGTFATGVTSWTNFAVFNPSLGNPPGSDQTGPIAPVFCGNSISVCLPIAAGDSCVLSAEAFVPVGQPTDGLGIISYQFFSDPNCSTFLSSSNGFSFATATQGSWIPVTTGPQTVPATAQSARISLNVCAPASAALTIDWDNVVSVPAPVPGVSIPALGKGALALLGALLAAAALWVLRRTAA